ncbi:hypothetical protein HDZ31DRAFT_43778 [Schizophyllum fasciatum]
MNPFHRRRAHSDAARHEQHERIVNYYRAPPAYYAPPPEMPNQVPPHERVRPEDIMNLHAWRSSPEPLPHDRHEPSVPQNSSPRRLSLDDKRPQQGARTLRRAGAITERMRRRSEEVGNQREVAFPSEMDGGSARTGRTLRERRPGTPLPRPRALDPYVQAEQPPVPTRSALPPEYGTRHNDRQTREARPRTAPQRIYAPVQPQPIAAPGPLPLQAPDLLDDVQSENSFVEDISRHPEPAPYPYAHAGNTASAGRSASASRYPYAHAGNTPLAEQQAFLLPRAIQILDSHKPRRNDEGLIWLGMLLAPEKRAMYLKAHRRRPPTLRHGLSRADLLQCVLELYKKLGNRTSYTHMLSTTPVRLAGERETLLMKELAKECGIEPVGDRRLFERVFYSIVGLAGPYHYATVFGTAHWLFFKSNSAHTTKGGFFERLVINLSPVRYHIMPGQPEGTFDQLLIPGKIVTASSRVIV